jgi:prevent-host-death family protein
VWRVVDPIFAEPRLAEVYDPLNPDRSDLDAYVAMVEEFGARSIVDIGCGTGTFACRLARRGLTVTAVDPAAASLAVARTKPGAERVRWMHGDATDLPPLQVELVTMTANVAQVFVTDEEWASTLRAAYATLRPGGRLVFETRDPAAKAWLEWNRERSYQGTVVPGVGGVEAWDELLEVRGDLVSFRSTVVFESDGAVLTSESTLRFRHRDEVTASLAAAGYMVDEVRQAPDRPGRELVFIARRADVGSTGTSGSRKRSILHTGANVRTTSHTQLGEDGIVGVVGVRELGRHASKVISDVRRSGRPVIVTVNGQPAAVVVPLKAEDLEDFVLSYGEQFVRDRLAADAELAAGKTVALDDVVAELRN